MSIHTSRATLLGLSAYRSILDRPILARMLELLTHLSRRQGEQALDAYTRLFYLLREGGHLGLGDWLWDCLRYEETPYALLVQRGGQDPALENSARRDIETLASICLIDCDQLISAISACDPGQEFISVLAGLPRWRSAAPFDFDGLTEFYRNNGAGKYSQYRAFLWERGTLIPVSQPDCPHHDELLGYELQRHQVIDNTRSMLAGNLVNNVLLFGDGGTGKSATVKSMLYLPGFEDLRLIEVAKDSLDTLPQLIRALAGRRQKFILFIDDLVFDQDDRTYSSLKTILEGGLEPRPANVAIYATSNRRHLVRQTFSDRAGDEVDAFETISEKTALAERFGLRIPYLTMSKEDFLALVDHLAQRAGVQKDPELLHAQAMTWEIRHAGRTPRTARQFINSLSI